MGESVKSLKNEDDNVRDKVKSLSEDFQKFEDKTAAKVNKEVVANHPVYKTSNCKVMATTTYTQIKTRNKQRTPEVGKQTGKHPIQSQQHRQSGR